MTPEQFDHFGRRACTNPRDASQRSGQAAWVYEEARMPEWVACGECDVCKENSDDLL